MRVILLILLLVPLSSTAHDVVVTHNVNLRAQPTDASNVIKLLKPGEEARLLGLEKQAGYYYVLHNAGVGWVWSRNVDFYPEYLRKQWKHWTDADGNCRDTRQEVLIEDSEISVTFESTEGCKVVSGRWSDPYSRDVFTDPAELDVDHMVPLRNAQRSGGWEWTKQRRQEYANDLDNAETMRRQCGAPDRRESVCEPKQERPGARQMDTTECELSLPVREGLGEYQRQMGIGDIYG